MRFIKQWFLSHCNLEQLKRHFLSEIYHFCCPNNLLLEPLDQPKEDIDLRLRFQFYLINTTWRAILGMALEIAWCTVMWFQIIDLGCDVIAWGNDQLVHFVSHTYICCSTSVVFFNFALIVLHLGSLNLTNLNVSITGI